jgi:hypothetical protein
MSSPTRQIPGLDAALLEFGQRVDEVRQQLYYVDVATLKKDARLVSKNVRANLYVQLAAAIEVHTGAVVQTLTTEITAAYVSAKDLRYSLIAISSGRHFAALRDVRGLKNWARRCDVLEGVDSADPVELDATHVPLDGRTIRPEHFHAIWRVFGLPGSPMPSPTHALALSNLADSRNDVAHGNEPIAKVAGRKSSPDMVRFIARVEEVAIHLYDAAQTYLVGAQYMR